MIVEKKLLTAEYIGHLSVGLLRYDPFEKHDKSLISVGKFLTYLFKTNANPYSILSKVFDVDNLVFLQIFSHLLTIKQVNPSMDKGLVKQELIDRLENTTDANSFNKAVKFIDHLINSLQLDRFNNSVINEEYDKCLKYILINDSISNLTNYHKTFFTKKDAHLEYEQTLATVFENYEDGVIEDDFILDETSSDVEDALLSSALVQEEVKPVDIFETIRFLENKRVAIIIGASGSGKSMLLCHSAAHYLMDAKPNMEQKNLVFYFTFENSKEETFIRIVANMLEIEIDELKANMKNPKYSKQIVERFLKKKDPSTVLVISELYPKRHSMTTIEAMVNKTLLKYKNAKVHSIILDYVDKMLPILRNAHARTDENLGTIVDEFKATTKLYGCAGITVSQFNRTGNQKAKSDEEMARATDIGGGWSKFENADVVITMQVKNTVEELGHNLVVFVNEKHRYFRDGTVIDAIYKPHFAKFYLSSMENGGMMQGRFQPTQSQEDKTIMDKVSLF
jgi:KaiC/GvpD/RAD55 family RecA-like ATPase